jgi:hypothetical protein
MIRNVVEGIEYPECIVSTTDGYEFTRMGKSGHGHEKAQKARKKI